LISSEADRLCPALKGAGYVADAGVTAAELASVRIAALAFAGSLLFAVVMVFFGYVAFVRGDRTRLVSGGLACEIIVAGADGPVTCIFASGHTAMALRSISFSDDHGTTFQAPPDCSLRAGGSRQWSILAEHSVRPAKILLHMTLVGNDGRISNLSASWEQVGFGYRSVDLKRIWHQLPK